MYLQKDKQRTSTVNLMARRQLHCQTSLIVSSVTSDVFKHLRFKELHITVMHTYLRYIVWQSTTAGPQVQLANAATQLKWCIGRTSLLDAGELGSCHWEIGNY